MTDFAFISKANPPWVSTTRHSISSHDIPSDILLLQADGNFMTNIEELYTELASVLEFPNYFGRNFNALHECLTDLEWLPANGYLLLIKNTSSLLSLESSSVLESFLSILNNAGEEWATPVEQGEVWDRGSIPFHTIFQLREDEMSDFQSIIGNISSKD